MNEEMNLNRDGIGQFYQDFGHSNFKLQSDIAKEFGDKQIDLYFKSIDFLYKLISSVGVIAGFGFVAIPFVNNIWVFIIGEGLLFTAIGIGLYSIQMIYGGELESLTAEYNKIEQHFDQRNKMFRKILEEKVLKGKLVLEDLRQLLSKDKELISIINSQQSNNNRKNVVKIIVYPIFGLFIVGTILILISLIC